MQATPTTQVFEYRPPGQAGFTESKWKWVLLWVVSTLLLIGMLFTGNRPWGKFDWLTFGLIYCSMNMSLWVRYIVPAQRSLTLTDDALIHICRLPFGLHGLFRVNWQISLRDITGVEVFQSPLMGSAPIPGMEQLCISQRKGASYYMQPAQWFAAGAVAPASARPESLPTARVAFADLPIVLALRARGIVVLNSVVLPDDNEFDLFASRCVKFGIVVGLALFVGALAIMVSNKYQHLQMDFSWWVYAALAGASLLVLWGIARRDTWRPPVFNMVLASIFLIAGVCMAAQPVATLVNGWGVDSEQPQAFTVHAGSLVPTGSKTGVGPIYVLAPQSRQTWLKEGTVMILYVKKGRLGLWEYDDTPLRALPDQ